MPAGTDDPPLVRKDTLMPYADLHLHLLPGVDDGAPDLPTALAHARRMTAEGVAEATVTPHVGHPWFPVDVATIAERTAALQSALDAGRIPLRLHAGGEVHARHAPAVTPAELDVISHGPRGSRWVLVEVPFEGIDNAFVGACRRLRALGYGVLVAHPERAAGCLAGGLDRLSEEIAAGALLQVNVCSLLGNNGSEAQEAGERLVRGGLAFVLASDGHPGTREHTLRVGFDLALAAGASSTQAWRLTQANPRFLLEHGVPRGPVPMPRAPRPAAGRPLARDVARVLEAGRRR
jgi:protein-tyrosine phosphatase